MNTTDKNPGGNANEKKRRGGGIIFMPVVLAVALVVGGGYWWYGRKHSAISTNDASVEATRVTVSSKIPGRIARLMFEEGDTVTAGDTMALLDNTDLKAQLDKMQSLVQFHIRNQDAASVRLASAKEDFERAELQFKNKIATLEHFNHIRNALDLATVQVKIAQAQIATAKADVAVIRKKIDDSVLRCAVNCVIARKWLIEGEIVQPGQALYTMYDLSDVWVTANYEETKLRLIQPDDSVAITLDAFPAVALKGHVEKLGISTTSQFSLLPARNASGNFTKVTQRVPVKIAFDNTATAGVALLPGLSATVRILAR